MEWLPLVVPFLVIPFIMIFYSHKLVWWELTLPMLPVLVTVPTMHFLGERYQTYDVERWRGWVEKVRYYEDWNEYVHQTCTRTVGSGKNARTETYDCSYVRYHPPYWKAYSSNSEEISITENLYKKIKERFGNSLFVELNRHYYTNDGDMYESVWNHEKMKLVPTCTEHVWENRVKASTNVYNWPNVDPKLLGLYEYPSIKDVFNDPVVLGDGGPTTKKGSSRALYWNSILAREKQVNLWILFFKNKPRSIAKDQESYWRRGKKNELVVCIGVDDHYNVTWSHVFSWTDKRDMLIDIRSHLERSTKFDLTKEVDYIAAKINKEWKRKNFSDFDYLSVDQPIWATIVSWILTILLTLGVAVYAVSNDIENPEIDTPWSEDGLPQFLESLRTKLDTYLFKRKDSNAKTQ